MTINQTALLIMDVQPPVADLGGPTLLERVAECASAARAAGVAVIYVKVGFRPGYPEIGPRANAMLTTITEVGAFVDGASTEVHEAIAPQSGEIVVTRPRVSAFAGGDLDVGAASSSYRLARPHRELHERSRPVHAASSRRPQLALTVLSDGCADPDDEVHRVLTEKVFPSQARVVTVQEWTTELR